MAFKILKKYHGKHDAIMLTDDGLVRKKPKGGKWAVIGKWDEVQEPNALQIINNHMERLGYVNDTDLSAR